MFVRKDLRISGITSHREGFGEWLQFIINDLFSVMIFYRNPSHTSCQAYDDCMSIFSEWLSSTMPTVCLGDFNW